ncbi:MAG: hypothetical protein JW982_14090 [Spirochaetes bacterium]|nr:hypothetical protein [Spirochaetota bacterium]
MGRDELRKALIDVIEYISKSELSSTSHKLIFHYFNTSKAATSLDKAVDAIERYMQDSIPSKNDRSRILEDLLNQLAYEARMFDAE